MWLLSETNQPKGRSAAQNHFLCLLALGTTLERHKTSARGDGNLPRVAELSEIQFSILKVFDIPQGILIGHGYNVSIADEGARYTEKERRHACHSSLKDFHHRDDRDSSWYSRRHAQFRQLGCSPDLQ